VSEQELVRWICAECRKEFVRGIVLKEYVREVVQIAEEYVRVS
jgi:hypothetical protein